MFAALALGALSAGGALLQGVGQQQASAKQARLQMMSDAMARNENERQLKVVNEARERLGREMLTVPEQVGRSSWVDTDAMMAAAERSGFNPVTWLNAGGMQAYTSTHEWRTGHNAADAYKMMIPEYALSQASQIPQQHSMLSAFGGALSAGASAFGTQYRADQSYDLQSQRLAQMGAATINNGMGLSQNNGLMTALSYGSRTEVGGSGSNMAGGLSPYAYPSQWKPGKVEVTNPSPVALVDPNVSDTGGAITQRWGEGAEWLFGVPNMFADAVINITGKSLLEWGRANRVNVGDYRKPGDAGIWPAITRWYSDPKTDWKLGGFGGTVTPYMPFPGANAY